MTFILSPSYNPRNLRRKTAHTLPVDVQAAGHRFETTKNIIAYTVDLLIDFILTDFSTFSTLPRF